MVMNILQILAAVGFITAMFLFVYIGQHIQEEKHQGKGLPMMWEPDGLWSRCFKKTRKTFDKSDIKYRDGDNT
jgi:hypothetical protein|tara:strand:+ start:350 stop:568 length:219 start_codon:yes stop_codon:yes gene_type:complete